MAIEKLKYIVTADTKGFVSPMKAIGALAVTAFVAAVKVTAEFEKELSKLRAISGATSREMVVLEKKARDLGKSTAFTAKEVASLQTELAKLGFTTNDILNSSGGVLDLAAGLGVTLADAASLTGTTLRAFGLTTEETGRVVDVLAKSAASSGLDFEKLQQSLKTAAPIAKATGTSIERTVAILSTLADAGISGSRAGTALRKTFIELNKKGLTLNDAYKKVNASTNKLGTAQKLVGTIAASAFLVMAEGAKTTDTLTVAYENAEGAAEKMRLIMEDNLIGDFDKLKSAVNEMGIQMGQTTEGPLRDLVQGMTDFINGTETTLGFIDSLVRNFLFLEESIKLVYKSVLEAQIGFNTLFKIKPSGRLEKELKRVEDRLDAINTKIIQISNYGGKKKETKKPGTIPKGTETPKPDVSPLDLGLADLELEDALANLDFAKFEQKISEAGENAFAFANGLSQIAEQARNADEALIGLGTGTEEHTEKTKELALGWDFVGGAIAGALATAAGGDASFGDIAAGLLKGIGAALIGIGVAAVIAGKALAIFGIGIPAIYHGYIAIAAGAVLVAGGSLIGGSASAGGGGGSSSAAKSQTTATTTTPNSVQGSGGSGLVATVRGQDLRFVLQGADETYGARN